MLIFLTLFLAASANAAPISQGVSKQGKVVVVVANRLILDDLDNSSLPAITKMVRNGAIGLVSPNCVGPKSEISCMVTAGAGTSCRGGTFVRDFYDSLETTEYGENAQEAYTGQTGYKAGPHSAVFLGLGPALRANIDLAKPARLGALGDALHESGKKTCVIGNSDILPDQINRSAAVLAMDSRGQIDIGRLSSSLPANADFTIIDFGSTTHLDDLKDRMTDKALALHKAEAMRDLDKLIGKLMRENITLVLVSFSLPTGDSWDRLTPIVIYGPKYKGVLTSPTTRTPGLVAASDFAPTILDMSGIPAPSDIIGRPSKSVSAKDKLAVVHELDTRVKAQQDIVRPVVYVVAAVVGLSFVAAIVLLGFSLRAPRRVYALIRVGLVAACAAAVAMMLAVLAPAGAAGYIVGTFVFWAMIVAVSFALGWLWDRTTGIRAAPMLAVYAISIAVIIVDTFTGCRLCKFALPSSYQLSGLRFYGIGNEYASILISMSALCAVFSGKIVRRWLAPALGALIILTLGMGRTGANYGATFAAAVTFGLISFGVSRARFGLRHVIMMFVGGFALMAVLAVTDFHAFGSAAAHAGRMASLAQRVGGDYVLTLIERKVLLNLRIIVRPEAMVAYAVLIPIFLFWTYRVPAKLKDEIFRDRQIVASLKGFLIGILAAFVLNDSGIVMAVLMFGMLSSLVLYTMMEIVGSGKAGESDNA
ncbi:MAG: hypothetical protein ABFD83_00125 [Armatimonadota bacterium]